MEGCLYPVGTPIGNLKDITLRALEVLKDVDLIASEDTRRTRKLLSHYDIHTPLISFYEHNELERIPSVIKQIKEGKNIALVSNAGMPGISDPGCSLIKEAVREGIRVVAVPGPTALVSTLVSSGFSTREFVFEGFLGRKRSMRLNRLKRLKDEKRTIIIYEAPHRIKKVLPEIKEILGDRRIAVGREITKKFEEILRGRVGEIEKIFEKRKPQGEFTLVIEGRI
ncbi:MAG: 16S rRNA (cytidine(1402)-2'-O)-methyltransferase [Candidatus Aerophobetes bacterium]|nr:16S rRNA (cytidine(1402)-2'-O)-methyltransferase [Candidatus Aerophobetes bacterium]